MISVLHKWPLRRLCIFVKPLPEDVLGYFSTSGAHSHTRQMDSHARRMHTEVQTLRLWPGSQSQKTSKYVEWFVHHSSDVFLVSAVLRRRALWEACSASLSILLSELTSGSHVKKQRLMWERSEKADWECWQKSFLLRGMSNLVKCQADVPLNSLRVVYLKRSMLMNDSGNTCGLNSVWLIC